MQNNNNNPLGLREQETAISTFCKLENRIEPDLVNSRKPVTLYSQQKAQKLEDIAPGVIGNGEEDGPKSKEYRLDVCLKSRSLGCGPHSYSQALLNRVRKPN